METMDDSDIIFLKNVITFGTKVKEFINTEDENNKILVFKYKNVLEEDDLIVYIEIKDNQFIQFEVY